MIGSGVFLLPSSLAPFGGLSFVGWVVSAIGAMLLALVFAFLARRHPAAGGVYAYTRDGYGDLAGFLVAWGYWTSIWAADAALAIAFVGYLDPFLPPAFKTPIVEVSLAVGAVWFLTFVNSLGVAIAGRVQVVTTVLKMLPLVVVGVGGLVFLNSSHFSIPEPAAMPAGQNPLFAVITLTLFAFVGLEAVTIPADAVDRPERTIPRATIVGTLVTALIYVLSTAGAMSLVAPAALASSTAPFAEAARALGGEWLGRLVALGAAISAFGALNGWILIAGQLSMAVARDGIFPKPFMRVNSRNVPVTGMIIAGVLSTGLIALNYSQSKNLVTLFTKITLLSTLSTLVPYTFCSLAPFLPVGRKAAVRGAEGGVGRPLSPAITVISLLAFVFSIVAIVGAGSDVVYLGFLLIVSGLPVYVWVRRT
jgi:APA family basic amino acid/polyamine antiporter